MSNMSKISGNRRLKMVIFVGKHSGAYAPPATELINMVENTIR